MQSSINEASCITLPFIAGGTEEEILVWDKCEADYWF